MGKKLIGLVNPKKYLLLGDIILFYEELLIQKILNKAEVVEAEIVNDEKLSPVKEIFSALDEISKITVIKNRIEINKIQNSGSNCYWPEIGYNDYVFGTTNNITDFYLKNNFIPRIQMREKLIHKAKIFLNKVKKNHFPIVVHLKNIPGKKEESNADLKEWYEFFNICRSLYRNVKFILVGKDKIDSAIDKLDNVVYTQKIHSELVLDLALVSTTPIFMGMASGFCNLAILGSTPYIIYKNPNHHKEEMEKELGKKDRYPFSGKFQRIKRIYESKEDIMEEFKRLMSLYE